MVSEKVTIVNPSGLHLLNAVNLSNSVSRYKSSMSFTYENNGMQGTVKVYFEYRCRRNQAGRHY